MGDAAWQDGRRDALRVSSCCPRRSFWWCFGAPRPQILPWWWAHTGPRGFWLDGAREGLNRAPPLADFLPYFWGRRLFRG
ncbi:hypothetical protein NDU88_002195 [Pleurodeles waltl]|uniref:Uncharacterized protein n=1 Tax=Pleurodeles waltl TaxID=8319 RepID=A0AAV7RB70_PLEWA|nr:hypothetical protein NDU88_002195 [Pleurodeles waltl]